MKTVKAKPEVFGPSVPWPHVQDEEASGPSFNPARRDRGRLDHQADCQQQSEQAT